MRERLTLAFVGLALVLMSVAAVVRGLSIAEITRTAALDHLGAEARTAARVVEAAAQTGEETSVAGLEQLVGPEVRLSVTRPGSAPLVAEGPGFSVGDLGDPLEVTQRVGQTTVSAVQSDEEVRLLTSEKLLSLVPLMLSLVGLAAVAGLLLAGRMSRPFTELAASAAALGRGRFDLDLPQSRIPEVAAIASSLRISAGQLRESIRRDRDFLEHASHVLRTPLTGMRLELEELALRDDLDDQVRRTTGRCLADVQRLDQAVGELLDFARGRALVSGAEVSLVDLGSRVAQRWRDELPESRQVRAFVDCGAEVMLTPGPVEQLLDSVLRDVVDCGTGPVELRFAGQDSHVKVSVRSGPARADCLERPSMVGARTVAEVLGGRYAGDATAGGLEIMLPRR